MKIDILIAGAFPESTDYTNITDSIFRIESIFGKKGHHLNFKYHTWMAPNILNNLVPDTSHVTRLRDQLRITRSPKVYNGYDIENDKFMSTNEWKNSRKRLKGKPNNHLLHILSVSELLINVRDLPDLYIVVKWGTLLSYNFDYEKYIKLASNDTIVGFKNCDETEWYENKKRLETGNFNIIDKKLWTEYIFDDLLMFKPNVFDSQVIEHWFKHKILHPEGWGWWQALSYRKNIPHINIDGIAFKLEQVEI